MAIVPYAVSYTLNHKSVGSILTSCVTVFGLSMVTIGACVFAVAAKMLNFGLMCFAQALLGIGVSSLERGANPYVTNCGPLEARALRLLGGQTMAAFGTIIASLMGNTVLYTPQPTQQDADVCIPGIGRPPLISNGEAPDLSNVFQLYGYIAAGNLGLIIIYAAVFFSTTWIPELPLEKTPAWSGGLKLWKHPIVSKKYLRLWYGCFCNFFSLACQVTVAQFILPHSEVNGCATTKEANNNFRNAQILFLIGRLVPAGLVALGLQGQIRKLRYSVCLRSRVVLWTWVAGAVALSAASGAIQSKQVLWVTAFIMFCEAPSFPMIFEAATVGLGDYATLGETMMIISISGGMVGPPAFGVIRDSFDMSKAWFLIVAFFALVLSFPTLVNIIPSWRLAVDQGEKMVDSEHSSLRDLKDKNVQISEEEKEQASDDA